MTFVDAITGEILYTFNMTEYRAVGISDNGEEIYICKKDEYYIYLTVFCEPMDAKEFFENAMACGGNWSNMLLSGIKVNYPKIYDVMPDREYSFDELISLIHFCGVQFD